VIIRLTWGEVMKSKIIAMISVFLILGFYESQICLGENFSEIFHKEQRIILNENNQVMISFVQDMDIDNEGNIWIIDWDTSQLYRFDKMGSSTSLIATSGQGPGELSLPQSIFILNDNIFVANFATRITKFNSEGSYINSFIPIDGHFPTSCIAVNKEGYIFIGGLKRRGNGNNLRGEMIHKYSPEGEYIKSFCPVDEKVRRLGLGRYCSIHFDLDEKDNIYAVQSVNYKIEVYDKDGNLKQKFGEKQEYYKEPKLLTPKMERDQEKMADYRKNFTYVKDLLISDWLLVVQSKNFLGENGDIPRYFIDIYETKSRKLLAGGIESAMNLYNLKNGKFYFFKALEGEEPGDIQSIVEIWSFKKNET
jgi:hypothetical protein